jgi:hypothetical protein
VTAGTVLVAGCGDESNANEGDSDRFDRNTRTDVRRTTARTAAGSAGDDDADDGEVNFRTETERERGRRPDDEYVERWTEEPTPTPGPMEQVRTHISEGVSVYTASSREEDLLEVTAGTSEFDAAGVRDHLSNAEAALQEVAAAEEVPEATVEQYETALELFGELVDCQESIIAAFGHLDDAQTALFSEDLDTAGSQRRKLTQRRRVAGRRLSSFERSIRRASLDDNEAVDGERYRQKVDQFAAEITGLERFETPISKLTGGLEPFSTGVRLFVDESYRSAKSEFMEALTTFQLLNTELIGVSAPDSLSDQFKRLTRGARKLERGTDHLVTSCRHALEDDDESNFRNEFRQSMMDARRSLGGNPTGNLQSYQELVDSL